MSKMNRYKSGVSVCFKSPVTVLIFLVILTKMTLFYTFCRIDHDEPYIQIEQQENVLSCHYDVDGDALPSAEDAAFNPRPNSIYFHETSCRGGLTSREACAVESAARLHPRRQVYMMFSAPVNDQVIHRSCLAKLIKLPNVNLARVHIADYAKRTPLEDMVTEIPFNRSKWWKEHTSDMLRYLTLYKWGGIYLDMDMLVVKTLTPLGLNWVARQNDILINAAAIAISTDRLGKRFSRAIVNEIKDHYRPDLWAYNGPEAVTRVVKKLCSSPEVKEWTSNVCQGLNVYGPEYIYPLYYTRYKEYFAPGTLDTGEAYTHHLWNKLSFDEKVQKNSPYQKMAAEFCPTIYEMYGEDFGNLGICWLESPL